MKTQAKYLALQLAITLAVYFILDVSLGYTALAVFVGWPIVGTLVTADDDLPGGWSSPDGTAPSPWVTAWFWGLLALRFSIAMLAFVVEQLLSASDIVLFLALAAGSAVLSVVLLKKDSSHVRASS
jgi:hypothetical protein